MSKLIFREKLEKYFKIPYFLPTMLCIKIYTDSQIKNLRNESLVFNPQPAPTSKKLEGHIAFGSFLRLFICLFVHPFITCFL